jgi:hypothetical protein
MTRLPFLQTMDLNFLRAFSANQEPETEHEQPQASNALIPVELTLESMLQKFRNIPPQTALLGVCDDGQPILFDLTDARTGSLIVLGDPQSGKTTLLNTLVQSAVLTNSPSEVQFVLISAKPGEWKQVTEYSTRTGHCITTADSEPAGLEDCIVGLKVEAEQRYQGVELSNPILMVIDDLKFVSRLDSDLRLSLEWLLKNGPEVHIWPIASLATADALEMGRWTSQFRTRLIGHMPEPIGNRLGMFDGLNSEKLQSGKQFAVRVQYTWLEFYLPTISG